MKITTEQQFEQLISSNQYTIVKFYTDWCPDCRRLDAFMPDITSILGDVLVHTLNKDELATLSEREQVIGIPSLLVYKNGEKIGHLHSANAKTPGEVTEFLSAYVTS
ncbi:MULTISPECIES: thioredoxin family protein [unclassified Exiguobacterium]|nr:MULTISPECIES: thioredoxin family protein [unclassified Exiguobacterium]